MPKRILIVYYTQTGQTLEIIRTLAKSWEASGDIAPVFEAVRPIPEFPFPWDPKAFFQAMPESVLGEPCSIAPLSLKPGESFDLIVLAWQAWFLSPSIPIQGFLQSEQGKAILKGKPVLTITGSRNMWAMAMEDIKARLAAAGARHVGNIALRDRAPNLLSLFSIARWLLHGKQEASGFIPRAGVSAQDIARCREFGESIQNALLQDRLAQLQSTLIQQGAVDVLPNLVMLEKRGKKIFGWWARFIVSKGRHGDPARQFRLKLFEIYLYIALFIASPISWVGFKLISALRSRGFDAVIRQYQSVSAD